MLGDLHVDACTRRRTALVSLQGELDLATAPTVKQAIELIGGAAGGVCHIVLDLRGLTFLDIRGSRELLDQHAHARANHHNLAIVRGTDAVDRVMRLTGIEDELVVVDDPDELAPPLPSC